MLKAPRKPNISKTVVYAIAVNALQILALLVFVVYVFLMDFSWQNRISLRTIAVVGALVAAMTAMSGSTPSQGTPTFAMSTRRPSASRDRAKGQPKRRETGEASR